MAKKKENLRTVITRNYSKVTIHHSKFELKEKVLSISRTDLLGAGYNPYTPYTIVVRGKTKNVPFHLKQTETDGSKVYWPNPQNGYTVKVLMA
jgi:hypothetical protein